ncbi:MAG: ABC transporter permease, partial [Spirochaetales bacterium]|nr:ABC transporter permease [Spirochaetales bacterium]
MNKAYKLWYKIIVVALAVLSALALGSVIILAVGGNVMKTYWIIISSPFQNYRTVCEVLIRAIPLIII